MQPFLILANQRSGSSVLRYALNEQKGVVSHGELLREGAHAKVSFAAQHAGGWKRFVARVAPERALRRYLGDLWKPRGEVRAAGFKLMYDQVSEPVTKVLAERDDVRFVHLVRTNALKSHLSYEVARAHERFTVRQEEAFAYEPIELDTTRLVDAMRDHHARIERHRAWLGERPTLDVTYEELLADPGAVVARVLGFLDVPGEVVGDLPLKKMTPDALDQAVTNADEVRAALRGTEFAGLIEADAP